MLSLRCIILIDIRYYPIRRACHLVANVYKDWYFRPPEFVLIRLIFLQLLLMRMVGNGWAQFQGWALFMVGFHTCVALFECAKTGAVYY